MKRVIIICEGQTEQEFCKSILSPFFYEKKIYVTYPLIKHSNGGIVSWNILKGQIQTHLKTDKTAYVTTFIDYYGIKDEHSFPKWSESKEIVDKIERITFIENEMKNDICQDFQYRFLPYIQLHEFEGLLFNNVDVFTSIIPKNELVGLKELQDTISQNANPEMINSGKETSPSHRLERIIKGYNKPVYGNIIAESIGLKKIREKCPRFDQWISDIANL